MTNSKKKGSTGELEFVNFLKENGYMSRRSAQYCGNSGEAADVICEDLGALHFEVKRCERLHLYMALDQAVFDAAKSEKIPIVAHRQNRKPWVIVLNAVDFIKLINKIYVPSEDNYKEREDW